MLPPPTKPGTRRYRLRSHRLASKQDSRRPRHRSQPGTTPAKWRLRDQRERSQATSLHLGTPNDIVSGLRHLTSQLNAFSLPVGAVGGRERVNWSGLPWVPTPTRHDLTAVWPP